MKTTLIYPLAIALAVTLAATGCRHKVTKVTPMPGMTMSTPTEPGAGTLGSGPTFNPGDNPGSVSGTPQPNPEDFYKGMKMDRAALAAYTIHFAYDSAVIRGSERASLQSVASALASQPGTKLLVEGNCDERGTEEYNRSLGEKRALAARDALVKLGLDPMRMMTESYGKDKPADPAHDEAAWSKNRRDDFVLLLPKPGM
jgi:peptidoglycan-associated lipoprotein